MIALAFEVTLSFVYDVVPRNEPVGIGYDVVGMVEPPVPVMEPDPIFGERQAQPSLTQHG
jgi:hypothetical protein